jgi:serine/threonine protein kinase
MPSFNTKKKRGRIVNRINNTVRNNHKRYKSLEPVIKNTSEEIGTGGFGIVSRPPARCDSFINKNFNQNAFRGAYYGNPNYISKLTEYINAKHELDISLAIKEIIPNYQNYFCLVEFICNAPKSKSINRNGYFYDTYAISPYCGIPLNQYLRQDINAPVNIFELCYLVPALQTMISGLQQLHLEHIYHIDIHDENILYDSETGLLRLIDFGLAKDLRIIKNNNDPIIIREEYYDLDMLVNKIIIPLINFLLDSRINKSKIHIKYPYIEDFYYQLRDFYVEFNIIMNPSRSEPFNSVGEEIKLTRLLNAVQYFKDLKSVNELAEPYFEVANNNNNK